MAAQRRSHAGQGRPFRPSRGVDGRRGRRARGRDAGCACCGCDRSRRPLGGPVTSSQRTLFADERHAEVLRLLATEQRVESARLARHFGVSAESIRKDLAQLEARGLLRRVHGGAVPVQRLREEPGIATRTEQAEQKLAIARHALRFVPRGGTLLLDAGTTTLRLAELLPADADLIVYTNAIPVLTALLQRGIVVVGLGGVGGRPPAGSARAAPPAARDTHRR